VLNVERPMGVTGLVTVEALEDTVGIMDEGKVGVMGVGTEFSCHRGRP
jgi:hypothetical protein